ncbi:MAG: Asp-tRNA(Asn)/Glu-tRNA(Gln) amidotransferase subunit GatB [Rickettsiales bacterium]|jgi:aspartyl-tRNA(Asn)/glutamyl-tRNA(Gln) amidotransferase subunit B|nr:Asp-tRNA(Asn)/Glu-tRNA(Gln) amidotransferase subunit GatB [Rickettsiales bacterium]
MTKEYIVQGNKYRWRVVIGLEVHCQVKSKSKLFSRSSTEFGVEQNKNVSFYDNAMPGQLPVMNEFIVEQAIKTGLGLNAEFNKKSVFDRKNYFYADLPSGYQITQFFYPIVKSGYLDIKLQDNRIKRVKIHEMHIEQDAGKLLHDQHPLYSMIDLNRSGIALMEIVSEPDMNSPEEAMTYLRYLRNLVRALDTCDGNMDEGSMRCDANVSVMEVDARELGTRCEVKNINSIKNVGDAIEYEAKRQVEILENGGVINQETRQYNALTGTTKTLRSKEDAIDYRYFPDPDLTPLFITDEMIGTIKSKLPELPEERKVRYIEKLGLSEYDAGVLTGSKEISAFFEKMIENHETKVCVNWLTSELFGRLNKLGLSIEDSPVGAEGMVELLDLIGDGTISGKIAKDVLDIMVETKQNPRQIVGERNLKQNTNVGDIEKIVEKVINSNPKQLEQYKAGNDRLFGFFVGQIMKQSAGKMNPQLVNEVLKRKIDSQN